MRDKCPECGAELQATIPFYVSQVITDDAGFVKSYNVAFENDLTNLTIGAILDCDPNDVRIYCANDHPQVFK